MKTSSAFKLFLPLFIVVFAFTSCDMDDNPVGTFGEAVERVPEVQLIEGADNATINVKYDRNYSYFTVELSNIGHVGDISDGIYNAWCIQMERPLSTNQDHAGAKLYNTLSDKTFNKLSYIVNNRRVYEQDLQSLSWKDIQVAMWVVIETRDLKLSTIEDKLPSSVQGFNADNVTAILSDVNNNGNNFTPSFGDIKLVMANASGEEQDVVVETDTESAWGYLNEELSICFSDIDGINPNNWGWSNGLLGEGTYTLELWAGAGQCDFSKGTKVGIVELEYDQGTLTATFKITVVSDWTNELYTMVDSHLYAGSEILPRNAAGNLTTAPGQYTKKAEHENGVTEYTMTISDLEGDIYVVAHATIDGFEPE